MSSSPPNSVASNGERQFGCGIPAVILYPSLGAPTFVVEPELASEHAPANHIHILLLSKEKLTPGEVNERLRLYEEFEYLRCAEKSLPPSRIPGNLKRIVPPAPRPAMIHDKPLCIEADAIEVRCIKKEGDLIEIPGLELHGYLNTETLSLWRSAIPRGTVHLAKLYHVSIDLARLSLMYADIARRRRFFITWSDFGTAPPPPSQRPDSRNFQDQALDEILTKPSRPPPGAPPNLTPRPPFLGKRLVETLRQAAEGHSLGLAGLDPDGLKPDNGLPVTTYHPVYRRPRRQLTPPKAKADSVPVVEAMNLGVISDLHLVTKFQILKNSQIRVAHDLPTHFEHQPPPKIDSSADGSKETKSSETPPSEISNYSEKIKPSEFLPPIGPMISDSVKVLKSHFEAMSKDDPGKSPDAVLVVGDLIDFHRDNFPSEASVLNPPKEDAPPQAILEHAQAIWKAVRVPEEPFLESTKERILEPNYQHGTSYLGILHLLAKFVTESSKPVFVVAGNHDAYADPFGLSPRVAFSDDQDAKEYQKANEGIPCDTNLTMLEAATCFGRTYGNFCRKLNVEPSVFQVFHLLFSPFRTWSLRMGSRQQMAFLHWGESEEMLTHSENTSGKLQNGHLPHAAQALSETDLDLIQTLAKGSPETPLTLVSHYTFACYAPSIPLFEPHDPRNIGGNVGKFHVQDVRNKSTDTIIDAIAVTALGAAAGAALGALASGGSAAKDDLDAGNFGAAGESFMENAADGALTGAVVGAVIGAGLGAVVMKEGATLNTIAMSKARSPVLELPNVYNWGTFHHKRKEVFELLKRGRNQGVSLTISGHAHRAAFYTLEPRDDKDFIQVRGHHFDELSSVLAPAASVSSSQEDPRETPTLMVVSDSAGPIPRKNIAGLLEGWGSQKPSWTFIRFGSGQLPLSIESCFTMHEQAKPRLAVALDYLESTIGHSKHLANTDTNEMLGVTLFSRPIFQHRPKRPVPKTPVFKTGSVERFDESLKNGADKPLWASYIPAPQTSPSPGNQESPQKGNSLPEIATPPNAVPHTEKAKEAFRLGKKSAEELESRKDSAGPPKQEYLVDPKDEKSWASDPAAASLFPDEKNGDKSGITFRTNIFSAFVSRPFSRESLRDRSAILLVNHGGAIQLPLGCGIESILLWMQIQSEKNSSTQNTPNLLFQINPDKIDDHTPNKVWHLHEAIPSTQKSALFPLLKDSGLLFQGYLRYAFSPTRPTRQPASSESLGYDLNAPWVVPCTGAIIPHLGTSGSFRLVFYRDIWGSERPDFKKFGVR